MIFARGRQNHPEIFFSLLLLRSHPLTIRIFLVWNEAPRCVGGRGEERTCFVYVTSLFECCLKCTLKLRAKFISHQEKLTNWLVKSLSTTLTHTMWLFCDFYLYIGMYFIVSLHCIFQNIYIYIYVNWSSVATLCCQMKVSIFKQ